MRGVAIARRAVLPCLLAGLVAGAQQYVVVRSVNPRASLGQTAGPHVLFWMGWVLLLPAIVRSNEWIARLRGGLLVRTSGFVVASLGFALCDIMLMIAPRRLIERAIGGEHVVFWATVRGWLLLGIVGYAVISAASVALDQWQTARTRELAAAKLAEQLTRARLDSLQTQLQPHFLFNSMNSIAMLCRIGEPERAVEMLAGVSGLLRELLDDREAYEVPLSEELATLARYVEIEQLRLGDRLQVEMDVPLELGELLVPRLILQPLVENAIQHGIAPRPGKGRVVIVARRTGDRLTIRIDDDGIGVGATPGAGVGLRNARERLRQLYRDDASLRVELSETGTTVNLQLPCHTAPWFLDSADERVAELAR